MAPVDHATVGIHAEGATRLSDLPVLVIHRRTLIGAVVGAALLGGLVASTATLLVAGNRTAPQGRASGVQSALLASPTPGASGAPPSTPGASVGPSAVPLVLPSTGIGASPSNPATATPIASSSAGVVATTGEPTPTSSGGAPADSGDPFNGIVDLVSRNAPAVVTITTESPSGFGGNVEGVGSGMVVDPSGWILTNNHVIQDASSISVALKDGRTFSATVAASNTDADLAVIKVTATGLPHITLGSSANLRPGQLMVAIGSPLGDFPGSVVSGVLSAVGRTVDIGSRRQPLHLTHLLQIDAPINPGNSGGPLFDAEGRVVGMITAVDSGGQGIAFAIPIDDAKLIVQRSIESG